ncbi:hypothetical protein J3R82DRAFT_8360, partial [Butyriboletus roseoflavus]
APVDTPILRNYLGEVVRERLLPLPLWGSCGYDGHHAEIHQAIYEYAVSIGVEIHFNHGVSLSGGRKAGVHLTIAASGVKSRVRYDNFVRLSPFCVF